MKKIKKRVKTMKTLDRDTTHNGVRVHFRGLSQVKVSIVKTDDGGYPPPLMIVAMTDLAFKYRFMEGFAGGFELEPHTLQCFFPDDYPAGHDEDIMEKLLYVRDRWTHHSVDRKDIMDRLLNEHYPS